MKMKMMMMMMLMIIIIVMMKMMMMIFFMIMMILMMFSRNMFPLTYLNDPEYDDMSILGGQVHLWLPELGQGLAGKEMLV